MATLRMDGEVSSISYIQKLIVFRTEYLIFYKKEVKMMANKQMKTLTIGSSTYDVVDAEARAQKVDKIEGKGLSASDYTDEGKAEARNR